MSERRGTWSWRALQASDRPALAASLTLAAAIPLRVRVTTYRLEDANQALRDLKGGGGTGARVLVV